jgi:hypothetical protein
MTRLSPDILGNMYVGIEPYLDVAEYRSETAGV